MAKHKSATVVFRLRSFADILTSVDCMVQLMGIIAFGVDVDETIADYNSPELPEENRLVFVHIDESGATTVLITNNPTKQRDHWLLQAPLDFHRPKGKLHLLWYRKGLKRFLAKFFRDYGIDPAQVAIVGNDFNRDIKPAVKARVAVAILVDPVGTRQFIGDKAMLQRRHTAWKGRDVPLFEPNRLPYPTPPSE